MTDLVLRTTYKPFSYLGTHVLKGLRLLRDIIDYHVEVVHALLTPPFRYRETIEQMHVIGVKSMPVILVSLGFAAAVTIMEYAYHMRLVVQTAALVPGFAALLVLRELGAVLTALLLTSRAGAGITAEVGTMKITEQIDALKLLSIDPIRYLVVPRLVACVLSSMTLVIFANATCLLFAMLVSIDYLNYTSGSFIAAMNSFASFKDFYLSIIKAGVFGSVIPLVSCFYGLRCQAGAEGVGHSTTQSVVTNAVSIIILDFILTYLFSYLY